MDRHICGQCAQVFDSEAAYIAHTCPKTGCSPADPQHWGPSYKLVQEAALARGAAKK